MIGSRAGMSTGYASPYWDADDRVWPIGLSRREFNLNAAWLIFLLGAANLTFPFGIGQVARFVWFPADILAIAFFLRNQTLFVTLARRNALLLSWPLLACASTLWSNGPGTSLYFGLQLFATVLVGMMLASQLSLTRLLQMVFVTGFIVSILTVLTVLLLPGVGYFHSGEWQGLYTHKNVLGAAMAAQITTGTCLFLYGWRRVFVAFAVVLAAFLLFMSKSGTALVLVAIPFTLLPLIFAFRKGVAEFIATVGMLIMAAATVLFLLDLFDLNIVDIALGKLGKDSTLTGRTVLWDFAIDAYERKPWLGYGYKGYWTGNGSTVYLLRAAIEFELFNFHNTYFESLVAFGFMGPVILIGTLVYACVRAIGNFSRDPTYINAWPILFLAVSALLGFTENAWFNNHGMNELLLASILTAGAIKGWERRGGELVQPAESGPRDWIRDDVGEPATAR